MMLRAPVEEADDPRGTAIDPDATAASAKADNVEDVLSLLDLLR